MARPRRIDQDLVMKAQLVAAQTNDAQELRAAQAVLLPALAHTTLEQAATLLGVGRATVPRLQARFRQQVQSPKTARPRWGGRRRALLSVEEEKAFLGPWKTEAEQGRLVVLSPVRAALAQKLGRPVAPSVVYRMCARQKWRKVAPDTRHPKAEAGTQAEWKKKRSRKTWRPC